MSGVFSYKKGEGGNVGGAYQNASLEHNADVTYFSAKAGNALFGKAPTNQMASLRLMAIIKI